MRLSAAQVEARRERDEARAEVERLRAVIHEAQAGLAALREATIGAMRCTCSLPADDCRRSTLERVVAQAVRLSGETGRDIRAALREAASETRRAS